MTGYRYFRWRTTLHTSLWALDRHWYGMLGRLYMLDHPELRAAPNDEPARPVV